MTEPMVGVIIPTTCDVRRAPQIHRAIRSVLSQQGVAVELLLVVNGTRVDEALYRQLLQSKAKVIRLPEGNVSQARYAGVLATHAPFFSFLDDDDEFLPGALACRLASFEPDVDCVVTNGLERDESDRPLVPATVAQQIPQDPVQAFMQHNWFASAGSMFRRATVEPALFDIDHRYFEWTWLFYLMVAAGKRWHYVDAMTYRVWKDSPVSASASVDYAMANADLLAGLVRLPLPPEVLVRLQRKHQAALNRRSQLHLEQRQRLHAWRAHLACLRAGGWRYLPFTRKLLV
jgi:glycosyltransferase involved in cell wall biosynthesis